MSHLMILLLKSMRVACLGAAGLLAIFIVIEAWKKVSSQAFQDMSRQDISFFVVMFLMLLGALWLARSITRELKANSGA